MHTTVPTSKEGKEASIEWDRWECNCYIVNCLFLVKEKCDNEQKCETGWGEPRSSARHDKAGRNEGEESNWKRDIQLDKPCELSKASVRIGEVCPPRKPHKTHHSPNQQGRERSKNCVETLGMQSQVIKFVVFV